jgi:acyl-coenzyme A thioesterase PaaI-like protein
MKICYKNDHRTGVKAIRNKITQKGEMYMETLPSYDKSFFVSPKRLDGLRLKMMWDGDRIYCDLRLNERFENETGTVLSGILFGIMDVMMWCAILMNTGKICVTHKVKVDFVVPVELDKSYKATSQFIRIEGRDVHVTADIKDDSGNLCAMVDAIFRENQELSLKEAIERLDFSGISPKVKEFFQSLLSGSGDGL